MQEARMFVCDLIENLRDGTSHITNVYVSMNHIKWYVASNSPKVCMQIITFLSVKCLTSRPK